MIRPNMLKSYRIYILLTIQVTQMILILHSVLSTNINILNIILVCTGFIISSLGICISSIDIEENYCFLNLINVYIISSTYLALVYIFSPLDRKSTRLNSSHANISYAVFCLKKKIFY